jgi:hypothetical protein
LFIQCTFFLSMLLHCHRPFNHIPHFSLYTVRCIKEKSQDFLMLSHTYSLLFFHPFIIFAI